MDTTNSDQACLAAEKWLNEQGYRLEFRCAQALEEAGFDTTLASLLKGADGNERDADVVAKTTKCHLLSPKSLQAVTAEFASLVECKYVKKNPWIVFGTAARSDPATVLGALPHNLPLRGSRNALARTPEGAALLAAVKRRNAFHRTAVASQTSKRANEAHATLFKVADLAWSTVRTIEANGIVRRTVTWLPLVVVDGPLLAATYDATDGRFRAVRQPICHLLWSHPKLPLTLIDVVEVASLPTYMPLLTAARDAVLEFTLKRLTARATAPARTAPKQDQIQVKPSLLSLAPIERRT